MAKIIVSLKEKIVKEIPLKKDIITIGRNANNDVHIDNPAVSRFHAKIIVQGDQFYVEDLQSTNGTYVNGNKVSWKAGIKHKDRIGISKYTLILIEEEKGSTDVDQKIASQEIDSTMFVPKKK